MAVSRKKRQRKIEKKSAKRKQKRSVLVQRKHVGFVERLAAANAPLLNCLIGDGLEDQGMASVLISRRLADGHIAFTMFLVDCYCLGIKDCFARIASPGEYSERFDDWIYQQGNKIKLADARKLVEEAAAYGCGNGFPPRGDYRKGLAILDGIDAQEATRQFEFGKDGKPFYINGPHESMADIKQIQKTLELNCGSDGYDCLFRTPSSMDFLD